MRAKLSQRRVSVIVPCYNHEQLLPRALASLVGQWESLEVIVIDDGSHTPVVLDAQDWPFELHLIRQANAGLPAARNTGLAHASGDYLLFLDADDELLENCIRCQVNAVGDAEDVIAVGGFERIHVASGRVEKILPAFGHFAAALLQLNVAPPHAYLFPAKLVRRANGFETGPRTRGGHEDYDLLLRLAAMGAYAVTVHRPLVRYYKSVTGMSADTEAMALTRRWVWAENLECLLDADPLPCLEGALGGFWRESYLTGYVWPVETVHCLAGRLQRHASELAREIACLYQLRLGALGMAAYRPVIRALQAVVKGQYQCLDIPAQALIDSRIPLPTELALFDYLQSVEHYLVAHQGRYAIFGAGRVGRGLLDRARLTSRLPVAMVDSRPAADVLMGVPLVTPQQLPDLNLDFVVIGSVAHYQEICSAIRAIDDSLPIFNPLEAVQ